MYPNKLGSETPRAAREGEKEVKVGRRDLLFKVDDLTEGSFQLYLLVEQKGSADFGRIHLFTRKWLSCHCLQSMGWFIGITQPVAPGRASQSLGSATRQCCMQSLHQCRVKPS